MKKISIRIKHILNVFTHPIFLCLVLIGITLTIYFSTLSFGFVFDDNNTILNNQSLLSKLDNLPLMFTKAPKRFLPTLSFALNYRFHGLDPRPYHAVNLCIHLLNGLLVFYLGILLLDEFTGLTRKKSYIVSFFSALFFLVHPIQTQAVTYVSQRYNLFAALFFLASVLLFIRAYQSFLKRDRISRSLVYFGASIFSSVYAFLSKENTYTLPFIILLLTVMLNRTSGSKIPLRKSVCAVLPYFLLVSAFIGIFFLKPGSKISTVTFARQSHAQNESVGISRPIYYLTQFNAYRTYFTLLVFPFHQNADYDTPQIRSLCNIPTLFSLLVILTILLIPLMRIKKDKIPVLAVLFFFITMSVESWIAVLPDAVFEYRLYLPSVGIFLLIAWYLFQAGVYLGKRIYPMADSTRIYMILCCIISSVFIMLTVKRNPVWRDEYSLWTDTVKKSPGKARVHYNYAVALYGKGNTEEALKEFAQAIRINPLYAEAYLNMGTQFEHQGEYSTAADYYRKALTLNPGNPSVRKSIADLSDKQGQTDEALHQYDEILNLHPKDIYILNKAGVYYFRHGEPRKSVQAFRQALDIESGNQEAAINLTSVFLEEKNYDQALATIFSWKENGGEQFLAEYYLGLIEEKRGNAIDAVRYYRNSLLLFPDFTSAKEKIELLEK